MTLLQSIEQCDTFNTLFLVSPSINAEGRDQKGEFAPLDFSKYF